MLSARRFLIISVIAVLAANLLPAPASAVPPETRGWSSCDWKWHHEAGGRLEVAQFQGGQFPPDNTTPSTYAGTPQNWSGITQSFTARLGEAMSRWNAANPGPHFVSYSVRSTPMTGEDVLLNYAAGLPGGVLGETFNFRRTARSPVAGFDCPVQVQDKNLDATYPGLSNNFDLVYSLIVISTRIDWFTMPDSMRSTWEQCNILTPDVNELSSNLTFVGNRSNSYLCSKTVDFGSTMIHELGHVLMLHHPETVDYFKGSGIAASTAARCYPEGSLSQKTQATMCAGANSWRSEGRTLDTWDIESIQSHYALN